MFKKNKKCQEQTGKDTGHRGLNSWLWGASMQLETKKDLLGIWPVFRVTAKPDISQRRLLELMLLSNWYKDLAESCRDQGDT